MTQGMSIYSILVFMATLSMALLFLMKKHLLKILLALEFLMLMTTLFLSSVIFFKNFPVYSLFMFFTMAVCEASMGISILISLMRNLGNESIESLW